jgi:hypothetical protein
MLRVLFISLAIVSLSLAIVLGYLPLYGLAAALLVAAGILMTTNMRRRHKDVPETFMSAPDQPEEDLASLGIMDIKPRGPEIEMDDYEAIRGEDDDAVGDSVDFRSQRLEKTSEPVGSPVVGKPRTKVPRPRIMVSEASSQSFSDVLIPALRSLRASIDAYTVCLLRQEEVPLRYHVEVMVSQNSYARNGGSYSAKEPILAGHRALVPVVYPRVGPNGFPKAKLGYYHEQINVRQVAMVPVVPKKMDDLFILLVDTMNDVGLEAASVRVLLEQYARLVSTILDTEAEGGLADLDATLPPKPRREIIAEEMERARSEHHPLSLALVFLNGGEEHEGEVSDLESAFSSRLKGVAVDARVERFGELTYGIFYHGAKSGIAAWASRIQEGFPKEDADLPGGVSVGVAVMDDRHQSADELRTDATAALQEAFKSGECIIVE